MLILSRFPYPFNLHEVVKNKPNTTILRIKFHIRQCQILLRIVTLLSFVTSFTVFMKMLIEGRRNRSLILLDRKWKMKLPGENYRDKRYSSRVVTRKLLQNSKLQHFLVHMYYSYLFMLQIFTHL